MQTSTTHIMRGELAWLVSNVCKVCKLILSMACASSKHTGDYVLGPVYTKRQHQRCGNSTMKLVILFSLETMELLQNGVTTHFRVAPLFSKRTVSLALSQSCCSVDTEAWCKRVLMLPNSPGGKFSFRMARNSGSESMIFSKLFVPHN